MKSDLTGADDDGPGVDRTAGGMPDGRCVSCGSPSARRLDTADGRLWMCPVCAVMHGLGCP